MSANDKPKLTDAIQVLEQAVVAVSLSELPVLLGVVEQIKAAGWMRIHTGSQNEHGNDELLTVPQVAKKLKLGPYRVYELARQGALKAVRLGKRVRIKPDDLAAYISRNVD